MITAHYPPTARNKSEQSQVIFLSIPQNLLWQCLLWVQKENRRKHVLRKYTVFTRGVQLLMQLGKYLAFNHDLHEIGTCIV